MKEKKFFYNLFVGSVDNNLYALDANTGSLKWYFSTNAAIHSSPVIYGEYVFFGSDDGKIYALDESTGELMWNAAPDYFIEGIYNYKTRPIVSSPVAYDGKIYFGSTNGEFYCYDAETYEEPDKGKEKVDVPAVTSLFLIVSFLIVVFVTMLHLIIDKRRAK